LLLGLFPFGVKKKAEHELHGGFSLRAFTWLPLSLDFGVQQKLQSNDSIPASVFASGWAANQ
jgi:hypothetical protein